MDFAAVGTIQGFEEKFDYLQVGQEDLVLITPCNHPLAKQEAVKLAEIAKYPFISREETSGTRKEIERLLETNKFTDGAIEGGVGTGQHRIRHNRGFRGQRHKHHQLNCRRKSPSCRLSTNRQNLEKPPKTQENST